MTDKFPPEAVAALERGNSIEAIKAVRSARGLGLKEAKDLVDEYVASNPLLREKVRAAQSDAARTLKRMLAGVILIVAVTAYFVFRR